MRVLIFAADLHRCGYRLIWPGRALAAAGHDVEVLTREDRPPSTEPARWQGWEDLDVVVFQRPLQRRWLGSIERFQACGVTVVVDIDDDFQALPPGNAVWDGVHPATSPDCNPHLLAEACRRADWVTVTTDALAQRYGRPGRVSIVPNHVPAAYLDVRYDGHDGVWVGWTGAVASHPGDLDVTRGAVARAATAAGAELHVVGPGDGVAKALGAADVTATGYVPLTGYPDAMAQLDVGIVPLKASAFNEAKCLDVGTRVPTRRGFIPIGDVTVDDDVWNAGEWVPVEAVRRETATAGVKITTELGRVVKMTADHRMLANGRWTFAGAITPGDVMACNPGGALDNDSPLVSVPWPAEARASRAGDVDPMRFTEVADGPRVAITERWARILGMFAGDGCCGGKTAVTFSCDGQDGDLIELLMDDLSACGLTPRTERVTTYDGTPLRRRSVRVANALLVRFLRSIGLADLRPDGRPLRRVEIPEVILRSPRRVLAAFLSGLFEADGTTTASGASLTTKHHAFALDVAAALCLLGIESRVSRRVFKHQGGESQASLVTLRRAAADVFAKEVGFLSARKTDRLARVVERPHGNAFRPMSWTDVVLSVEPCMLEPVDLQVAGSVFAANGLVSHNSYLKGLEFASLGVPFVASPTGPYRQIAEWAGVLARKPREWYSAVRMLAESPDARAELAGRGRQWAAAQTVEGNIDLWWDAWTTARERSTRKVPA